MFVDVQLMFELEVLKLRWLRRHQITHNLGQQRERERERKREREKIRE
jgi:hypothetical protein